MQIDNNALMKILSMNDDELRKIIVTAAGEGGVQIPNISAADVAKLRAALGSVGSDPKAMSEIMNASTKNRKHQ